MSDDHWRDAVLAAVASSPAHAKWRRCGGSSLNATWELRCDGGRYFIKTNDAAHLAMFEAEAEGLRELGKAQVLRIPKPLATGSAAHSAYLVLEHVEIAGKNCGVALGTALAQLHAIKASDFGWHRDNTIGTTPQRSTRDADWIVFWREQRLVPQLALAVRNGYRRDLEHYGMRLAERLPGFFASYTPVPSLLHGDLWGGNWGCLDSGEPVIFDPAFYYGDREADLAMTELFGGFTPRFHAAYQAAWPLDAGYGVRKDLYNLYHILNHLNLFGAGYLSQAQSMLGRLLAEVT